MNKQMSIVYDMSFMDYSHSSETDYISNISFKYLDLSMSNGQQ